MTIQLNFKTAAYFFVALALAGGLYQLVSFGMALRAAAGV